MNPIFQKTRELGDALILSEEYIQMKAAEEAAKQDEQAMAAMNEHTLNRKMLETLLKSDNPDMEAIKRHSEVLESMEERLALMDSVTTLNEKRQVFASLVNQINQVLRFIITGEMDEESEPEDGCSGGCKTCGGCSKLH